MNKLTLNIGLLPSIAGAFFCLFSKLSLPVLAQVSPDGSTSTTVEADNSNNFTINNGDLAGDNLFHSFQDFSVPTNGSASFNNATNITNIFSRVTGGNISNIDGLISANGTANLFLINPAGILFGSNASLDIGGSFYGTTADSVLFDDGELNALDADNPPLLTINAPIGLSFRDNPADIQLENTNITIQPTQTLAFLGGNIDIQGGFIQAPKGQVLLGGLSSAGTITLDNNSSFTIPQDITRGDISISDGAVIDMGDDQGGTISLQGKNITVAESFILTGILPDLGNPESQGGTIEFNASESVILTDNTVIDSSSFGIGSAGEIIINAQDSLTIDNQTALFSTLVTSQGQAGNISITTNNFALNNESRISAITEGAGDAGDINIETNSISFNNIGAILNGTLGAGNAGDININTQSLALNDGSSITSSTQGEGNAGNIQVNASDSVSISGVAPVEVIVFGDNGFPGGFSSGLFSTSAAEATGQGGTISVTTGKLSISDGATLSGRTRGTALGGEIIVNADTLDISGGGQILTAAFDEGNAGNITLNVANEINISGTDPTFEDRIEEVIELNSQIDPELLVDPEQTIDPISPESGIFASTGSDSTGNAGNISIRGTTADGNSLLTPELSLSNDGQIAVESQGEGNGGNLSIEGSSLGLENNAEIRAGTPQGEGGIITLDIEDNVTLREESLISAEATNNANGGNINIDADFIVAFPQNSDILASAEQGAGGNINITAEALLGIEENEQNTFTNDIDASSEFGLDGTVSIITPDINILQGVMELPRYLTQTDTVASYICSIDSQTKTSNLVVTGKGGIPRRPDEPLDNDTLSINGETKNTSHPQPGISAPIVTSRKTPPIHSISTGIGDITPAQGATVTEDGQVMLTTYKTSNPRTHNNQVNCG